MTVDSKLFESLNRLVRKFPHNTQLDWFVIGFLYAHAGNTKSLEDVFNSVNNVTSLEREESLSREETNDILIRMMNNLGKPEKSKIKSFQALSDSMSLGSRVREDRREDRSEDSNSRNFESKDIRKNGGQSGREEEILMKKSLFLGKMNGPKKEAVPEDDVSYKSDDSDSVQKRGDLRRKDDKRASQETGDDVTGEKSFRKFFGIGSQRNQNQISYVKKPIEEVDVSDLQEEKNLKRKAEIDEEALSMELIRKLQEEDRLIERRPKEVESLIEKRKEQGSLIEKKQKEENKRKEDMKADGICSICLSSLLNEPFTPLEHCEHVLHTNCFAEYLKAEIHSRHFPIKCPSNCGQEISQADMMQVLDKDLVKKYYDYSIQKYVATHNDEISCCPTPNCSYAFVQDDGENNNILNCPLCKKRYCLNCHTEYHRGVSCKENQLEIKKEDSSARFEKFVKGKNYKQCSKCRFWVEREEEEDHLKCRCGYQFCYKCGGRYRNCECVKKMQEEMQKQTELAKQLQRQYDQKNKRKKQ